MKKMLATIALVVILCIPFSIGSGSYDYFEGEFYEGVHRVSIDIPPAEYMVLATSKYGGYVCVSSDANGNDIIFNDLFDTNTIITVQAGEYVELSRCYAMLIDLFYESSRIDLEETGVMLRVGYDIAPGEHKLTAAEGEKGYYCVYPDSRRSKIVANKNFENSAYVKVKDGQYLALSRCFIEPSAAPSPTEPIAPVVLDADGIVYGITRSDDINVRELPTASASRVTKIAKKGTEVVILGSEVDTDGGMWYRIWIDGAEAYILGKFIDLIP